MHSLFSLDTSNFAHIPLGYFAIIGENMRLSICERKSNHEEEG